MKKTTNLTAVALASSMALGTAALPMSAQAELTANMGVVSKYVLRGGPSSVAIAAGATNEDPNAALQGGFDYSFGDTGFYLGYWGSSLGYATNTGSDASDTGFENDFYGGYKFSLASMDFDIGAIYYAYLNVDDSDATEILGSIGYGPVSLTAKHLTSDVAWGNDGDTYWTINYSHDLPKDFNFGLVYGYYTYSSGPIAGDEDGFKDLDLTLSHPIGKTGADMSITYIVGGKDRLGDNVPDNIVFGIGYGFDI